MNEKITRREFIKIAIKSLTVFIVTVNSFFNWENIFSSLTSVKKFKIPTKPFNLKDIYKNNNLAG